jgi:Domain of unknown function (DUF5658)
MYEHRDGTRKETTYQTVNQMNWILSRSVLPVLAILNVFDASMSYVLFRLYGNHIEGNPLVSSFLIRFDGSGDVFLALKFALSGLILTYWYKADNVTQPITGLTLFGVLLYSGMFLHGAYTFLLI